MTGEKILVHNVRNMPPYTWY